MDFFYTLIIYNILFKRINFFKKKHSLFNQIVYGL
jgi:hypothetical protein